MGFFSGVKDFLSNNKSAISSGLALGSFGLGLYQTLQGNNQLKKQNKQVDEQNALARESYEYQKYLNENRYQISALDAQKAGISPLAMSGVNLGSSSVSPAISPSAPVADLSTGLNLLSQTLSQDKALNAQKEMNAENNETSKEVALINAGQSAENSQRSYEASLKKIEADSENLIKQQEHLLLMDKLNKQYSSWQSENAYYQAKAEFEAQQDKFENDYNVTRSQLIMELENFWREANQSGKYDRHYDSRLGQILGDVFKLSKDTTATIGETVDAFKRLSGKPTALSEYIKNMVPEFKRSKFYDYVEWSDRK